MIPGLTQWVKDPAAAAPLRPLAWELLYAAGAAVKRGEKKVSKTEAKRGSPGHLGGDPGFSMESASAGRLF